MIPTNKIIKAFDDNAALYADKYKDISAYHDGLDEFIRELPPIHGNILDLACGPGIILQYINKTKPDLRLTGIDLAPNMLAIAKQLLPQSIFLLQDVREYEIDQVFDGIICSFILPYLNPAEVKSLFIKAHDSLTIKGLLYISTMIHDTNLLNETTSSDGNYQMKLNYHSEKSIIKMLRSARFNIMSSKTQNNSDTSLSTSKDLIVIAKK